jgi:hypothetical protein
MNTLRASTQATRTPPWLRLVLLAFLLVALAVGAFAGQVAVRSAATTVSRPPAQLAAQCPGVPFPCH